MKKENVKILVTEIVKLVFEFFIFRWGKSYERVNKLCTGECFDDVAKSASDVLERSERSLERAKDDVRELSDRAEKNIRRIISDVKKK